MLSIWAILQILLLAEVFFTVILVMNILLPIRKIVVKILRFCFLSKTTRLVTAIIAIILLFTFAYTYYQQSHLSQKFTEAEYRDADKELQLRVRVFREQRNMYLSGLTFFHGIFLWRLVQLYESVEEKQKEILHEGDNDKKSPKKEVKAE